MVRLRGLEPLRDIIPLPPQGGDRLGKVMPMDSFCPTGSGSMAGMEISSCHLALLDHLARIDQTDSGQVVSDLIQHASGIPVQSGIPARQCGTCLTSRQAHQGLAKPVGQPEMFFGFSIVKNSCKNFLCHAMWSDICIAMQITLNEQTSQALATLSHRLGRSPLEICEELILAGHESLGPETDPSDSSPSGHNGPSIQPAVSRQPSQQSISL